VSRSNVEKTGASRVLALILAGGAGNRLDVLTAERAKPAMPYAGVYRLIDFPLSNCMHSGISDVWVLQQYQPHSLNDHLSNGRPWDLDRTQGGLRLLPPFQGKPGSGRATEGGWHEGNADAIYRHKPFIEEFEPDFVLVLSADHLYKLDYRRVLRRHLETGADVTMVTKRVPLEMAGRFGTVAVDGQGGVTDFEYKPEEPRYDLVTTEIFLYDAAGLLGALEDLAARDEAATDDDPGDSTLQDFGHGLLPKLVRSGGACEYRMESYWRDVGTVGSYWETHMDLLTPEPELDLDDPRWPILTRDHQRSPAHIEGSARIDNGLVSPGCIVRGRVERSVLAPGVVVEDGATVRDSVILHDAIVGADATVERAVVDADVRVGAGARIGGPRASGKGTDDEEAVAIAVVGQRARIPQGAEVPAGGRVGAGSGDGTYRLADDGE
jgi:glucose-1-phosphate adenylyltransferase